MIKKLVAIVAVLLVLGGLTYHKLGPAGAGAEKRQLAAAAGKADAPKAGAGKAGKGDKADKGAAALKVSAVVVRPQPFRETIAATGTLRADEGVELQAETNGKITSINFGEGAPVRKGTLLVKLNDADLRANLERYRQSKLLAESKERRYAALLAQHVVTQADYDAALTDVNVQQAFIDLYQAQIEKTEIRAPFDGVAGLRYVSTGAYVNAATRIATLQRLDKLKVDFSLPEKYSGRVRVGAPIAFTVAGGDKHFAGQIYAIDPRIDSATRTLLVRAICANAEGNLVPGAFANVSLQLEQVDNAVLIPAEAVIPGLDEKNVFVVRNGQALRRTVETGSRTASEVHILAGLQAGDVVITSALQQMRAGQAVEVLHDKVAGL